MTEKELAIHERLFGHNDSVNKELKRITDSFKTNKTLKNIEEATSKLKKINNELKVQL